MGVTRREASEKIFRLLADYVLSADSTYGLDLRKCYNGKNMLVIIGETKINFSDAVLIQCEVDLAMFVYSVFVLNANVSHTKEPIEIYNNVLCQPEDEAHQGRDIMGII